MRFEGNGQVYIPSKSRFIRFVGGLYATSDPLEIEVLSKRYVAIDEPLMDLMGHQEPRKVVIKRRKDA